MSKMARVITFPTPESRYVRLSPLGKFEGFCVDIWRQIADNLTLSYDIRAVAPFNKSKPHDVPWEKMLKQLESDEADAGV